MKSPGFSSEGEGIKSRVRRSLGSRRGKFQLSAPAAAEWRLASRRRVYRYVAQSALQILRLYTILISIRQHSGMQLVNSNCWIEAPEANAKAAEHTEDIEDKENEH